MYDESPLPSSRRRRAGAAVAAVLGLALATTAVGAVGGASPAAAASAGGTGYGQWDLGGGGGGMTVPVAGFPAATVSTDSTTASSPSGSSAFLNASTPFGAAFGSSQNQPYALLRTAAGTTTSTTTLDFATAPTAGSWGFALGDIDADSAQISAIGVDGEPVSVADLGFQSAFNFCQGTPLPSACGGTRPTDVPAWDATTGTLTGNVADTNGASGWFRPTVALKSLTIKFSALAGLPVYQLWVATARRTVGGTVTTSGSGCTATGDPVLLLDSAGDPVTDASGNPVTATVASDGTYSFPDVAPGAYRVKVATPSGSTASGTTSKTADTTGADATSIDFRFRCGTVKPPTKAPVNGTVNIPIPPSIDRNRPIVVVKQPEHGTVNVDKADGVLVYTPESGYQGTDSFVYVGESADGRAVVETVSLLVTPMLPATGAQGPTTMLDTSLGLTAAGLLLWLTTVTRRRRRLQYSSYSSTSNSAPTA
jgi:hypothetical protein